MASFRGDWAFLSNFYRCPVWFKGRQYQCSEAAFVAEMAYSTLNRDRLQDMTGAEAKAFGKTLKAQSYEYAQSDMKKEGRNEPYMLQIMFEIVLMKFAQNPDLRKKLVAIEGDIVEVNEWKDTYWGVYEGVGNNHLGKILMQVRDLLRNV